jgi:uncharacterized membrane protein
VHPLHPLHAVLLAGPVPTFLGALFGDVAYWASYETQWKNFASWSIVWGLLITAVALAWTIVALVRTGRRGSRGMLVATGLLLAAWLLGVVNVLVHAGDAWTNMPAALALSAIVGALALAAAWIGLSGRVTATTVAQAAAP